MVKLAHLIPLFPFLAFWLILFFGRRLGEKAAYVAIAASLASTILAWLVFQGYCAGGSVNNSYTLATWLTINGTPVTAGVIIDSLTLMMLLVVGIVGTLIQIYSTGYMAGDVRFPRYFAYLSLFMSSMLALVLADNLLTLYLFWEGVGLSSCLLVAFWHEKPAAAAAGVKAFITTRVGDTGLFIGILILIASGHSLRFTDFAGFQGSEVLMTIAAILIFMGAVGKSAQFPLHVWLPDAMEGPTAVSALIHAATMVAAGVYLVARSYALFSAHPMALHTVAVIGAISAVMAASIACTANDIKRILAYSTISQLGLMMLALGVGGYTAGNFHLMTHAFFKALLFLGAGSVIHAVHTQDIRQMGGLFNRMKVTSITFIVGALALAGVMPFAGFWSKDEIFLAVRNSGNPILFAAAAITSLLTAFYMARLILMTFFGAPRSHGHAHESPGTMTVPLIILSLFAAGLGFIGSPVFHGAFQNFIAGEAHTELNGPMILFSTLLSFTGITIAYLLVVKNISIPGATTAPCQWFARLVTNKYYIDELYAALFIRPFIALCQALKDFDKTRIDGVVNGLAWSVQRTAQQIRKIQTGLIENYLLLQVGGVCVLMSFILGKICRIF
jgi:NADH-quinone oxidoreductase subunit L